MAKLAKEQLEQIQEYINSLPENERESKLKEIEKELEETPQCPYCLMTENKIKTTRVYENQNFMAVLEINPAVPGHTLLFTKKHIKNFTSLSIEETEEFSKILKKLESSLLSLYGSSTIIISDGLNSGNRFDHFITNLIPRQKDDQVIINWKGAKSDDEVLKAIQQKILEGIPKEKPKEPEPPKDLRINRKYLP